MVIPTPGVTCTSVNATEASPRDFTCGECPAGFAGDGFECHACPLRVTVPFASFNGDTVPRSSAVRLFGEAAPASATVKGFPCSVSSGLSFTWRGEVAATGDPIPLTFANQVNSKTLFLPPKALPADQISRFVFRTCYAANPAEELCGEAPKAFQAVTSPLVRSLDTNWISADLSRDARNLSPCFWPLAQPQHCSSSSSCRGKHKNAQQPLTMPRAPRNYRLQVASIGGGNTAVGEGSAVTLDASRSFDPDGGGDPLSFQWSCVPPPALIAHAAAAATSGAQAGPCQTADGAPLVLAPAALLTLRLLGAPSGANYTLSVFVSAGERTATASAWLTVFAGKRLPVISLAGPPAGARANPDAKLTLKATVVSADPASLSVAWTVVSVSPPPPAPFNLNESAATPLDSPSLVISPGRLPPRSTVVLRLFANDTGGNSTAEATVAVSGTPFSSLPGQALGAVAVHPRQGTGLNTTFSLRAENWTDTDLPLSYAFYYSADGAPDGTPPVQISDFKPQSAVSGVLLPAGDPSRGSIVRVFCVAQNAAGATAQSEPVALRVTWDAALLEDTAKQSALVAQQSAGALSQVLTGNPDSALSAVSGLSSLLSAGAAEERRRRRRLLLGEPDPQQVTKGDQARSGQREALIGVVAAVVDITLPVPTVRRSYCTQNVASVRHFSLLRLLCCSFLDQPPPARAS